jgi:DNA polymerase I-like protein with 3'-5' exonuclease and polymerase domains
MIKKYLAEIYQKLKLPVLKKTKKDSISTDKEVLQKLFINEHNFLKIFCQNFQNYSNSRFLNFCFSVIP